MKEIRTSQETSQTINAGNQTSGVIITLRDLKSALPDTRLLKTPTYKELRALQPFLEQPLGDGGLWVYPNGFALYRSGKRTTVLRIARASIHTYEFADGDKNCSLNDQPWSTALVLYGEGRIEQNIREWDERWSVHYDDSDDFNENDEQKSDVMANGAVYDENRAVRQIHNRKLEALEDLIESANGKNVLIAYWFKHDRERIMACKPMSRSFSVLRGSLCSATSTGRR